MILKRFIRFTKESSIRSQIFFSVILNSLISIAVILFMASLFSKIMDETGNSFETNTYLDNYLEQLSVTKSAMEAYVKYKSFGSIDKYYDVMENAQNMALKLHENPSTIEVFQKEYIIRKLSLNFFDLSMKAIAARRGNRSEDARFYYERSLDCYSHLKKKIVELDIILFNMNAKNYNSNRERIQNIVQRLLVAMFILIGVMVIVPLLSVFTITKPLAQISSTARRLSEKDFDVPLFKNEDNDEVGNICRAFNAMIISIRDYIDQIWERAMKENELREKEIEIRALYTEARLKALQDQIKPHFLFNTLNTGAQLANIEGADKTCSFLEQVSAFLRYNLQHPGNEATIGQELGMLDNYIYIMKVRFDEKYQFIKNIDESLLSARMPNMILQPLVENCLKHGFKDMDENQKGIVKIFVQKKSGGEEGDSSLAEGDAGTGKDSYIEISISDNGNGFAPGVRERVLAEAERGGNGVSLEVSEAEKGIEDSGHVSAGLVNVISRLRMYFKYSDVFAIKDNPDGKGSEFLIKIKV